MIQLIWGILNVFTFLVFITFCINKAVEIRQKIGLFVAILFSFFALSFITKPSKSLEDKKFEFHKKKVNQNTFFSEITLEDDLATKIELNVVHDDENAISAIVTRSGFLSGTEWKTQNIFLDKLEKKNIYQYSVTGTRKWKILGIEIYSEFKQFRGVKEFKPK
ncbi:hypothetical protein NYQ10_08615 [Flavobacterium johnsoniae]|uniref:hypothetical protein n=1 Tax=Flavobacterium johnsoniae TaxID=986 RepID=UPI0025B0093A|nr:hypothetical protein [Flavobacterium johnsoniae]WJS96511.1 hypothetical protein NYQ10_08615 [Flavobacterium johnsoniae]